MSEALDLTWSDVDLEHGVLNLEENKTDDPRTCVLDAGVAEALRRWRGRSGKQPSSSSPVFVDPAGFGIDRYEAVRTLRERLRAAGVLRPQLFETSETRMAIRAHDLRASFITVNLALGKTEPWITDRTGHRSSQMIYTYKRAARTLADLKLGGFDFARVSPRHGSRAGARAIRRSAVAHQTDDYLVRIDTVAASLNG